MINHIKRTISILAEKLGRNTKNEYVVLSKDDFWGDFLTFESRVHRSVGMWYELDYDKDAFTESRSYEYVDSSFEANPCPGGDEQIVTICLTPLKKGRFCITEIENFRGERTVKRIHKIWVK